MDASVDPQNMRKNSLVSGSYSRRQSTIDMLARKASMYRKAAKRLFSTKIMTIIHEDQNKKYMLEKNKSQTEVLIEEIKKSRKVIEREKKEKGVRRFTLEEDDNQRDIDRICFILKNVPGFKRFMIYNNVDEEAIRIAANYLTYHKVSKGEYVFKQGDTSKHFYGIINGKISIRLEIKTYIVEEPVMKRNNYLGSFFRTMDYDDEHYDNNYISIPRVSNEKPVMKEVIKEEEVLCRTDGYCFGEWGLIYKAPRSSSAFALEDTELFVLDEESFILSFNKCLSKAEIDRKNFLLKRISPFSDMQFSKFHTIYKTIVPIFMTKGQLVFLENTPADKLYVVYMGSCVLQKNINKLPEEHKTNINKMKFTSILKIDKGDIIGHESLMSPNGHYKYTLQSDSDYTVLLSVKVEKLDEYMRDKMKNNFQTHFNNFEKNIENILEKKRELDLRTKITYRKDLLMGRAKNFKMSKDQEKIFQAKVDEKVREAQSNKNSDKNQGFRSLKINLKDKVSTMSYKKLVNQTKYLNEQKVQPHERLSSKLMTLSKYVENKPNNRNKNNEIFEGKNDFLNFLTLSCSSPTEIQQIKSRLDKYSNHQKGDLTKANENTLTENNCALTTRDSFAGINENHAKKKLMLKFDKSRTYSALIGSKEDRKRNIDHKKTVTLLTTETNTNSNPSPRYGAFGSFNHYANTEPSTYREDHNPKNLDRVNSLISFTQEGIKTISHSRPQSSLFSPSDSLTTNPKFTGALHNSLHKRRKGLTYKGKKNLLLQKNLYSYEKEPIIIDKPLKSNLVSWNNTVIRKANFNSGQFNMPLVSNIL